MDDLVLIRRRKLWVMIRRYRDASDGWYRKLGSGRWAFDLKGTRFSLIVEYF